MSTRGLQTLLASSVTDNNHRLALLARNPAAYEGFDLSAEEVGVLLGIRATTLEEFALQAHRIFYNEDLLLETRVTPHPAIDLVPALDVA